MKRELPEGHFVRYTHYRYDADDLRVDELLDELGGAVPGSPEWEILLVKLRSRLRPERSIRVGKIVRDSRGGMTEAEIFDGDPKTSAVIASGHAYCRPDLDNYNRKIGREIALGRALKSLEGR